jgi:hypothetical protein
VPHTLSTHTIETAQDARTESANVAMTATMAAIRSPYATGTANAGESEGDTTPRNEKAEPDEPKCVKNHQRKKGIVSTHDPEPRPDEQLRDKTKRRIAIHRSPPRVSLAEATGDSGATS